MFCSFREYSPMFLEHREGMLSSWNIAQHFLLSVKSPCVMRSWAKRNINTRLQLRILKPSMLRHTENFSALSSHKWLLFCFVFRGTLSSPWEGYLISHVICGPWTDLSLPLCTKYKCVNKKWKLYIKRSTSIYRKVMDFVSLISVDLCYLPSVSEDCSKFIASWYMNFQLW